jgi:hypothetical protein
MGEFMITFHRKLTVALGAAALAVSGLTVSPALAAPTAASHAERSAHAARDRFLLRVLSALALHAVVNHGYVGATGPFRSGGWMRSWRRRGGGLAWSMRPATSCGMPA